MNFTKIFKTCFSNDTTALNPEWWAAESLVVLEEMLVASNLVNMDFSNYFVNAGDTVHVNKPGTFTAKEKVKGSATTVQDATATDTTVKLNQHPEVTFSLDDRDIAKALPELRNYFLVPAMRAMAERIDNAVIGEAGLFHANSAGVAGGPLTANHLIHLGKTFDSNNNPSDQRYLVVGPAGKSDLLGIDRFSDSDKAGTGVSAAILGRIGYAMGFDIFLSQNAAKIGTGCPTTTETINNGSLGVGTTTLTIDTAGASHTAGTWCKIAGVEGVYRSTSVITGSSSTTMTISPGLRTPATDGAVITFYECAGLVNGDVLTTSTSPNVIVTDGYAAADDIPSVGEYISIGNSATVYMVIAVGGDTWASSSSNITLTLNRPLDATASDGATINVLPEASYNFAFRPDAITLVNRPLMPATAGVQSAVVNNGKFAMRVTVGYNMSTMAHTVTVDTLIGVKTLDLAQGAILIN